MKNRIINFLLLTLFVVSPVYSYSQQKNFVFETQNIEIKEEGNLIIANFGKAISKKGNYEIIADNFKYYNDTGILEINGNGLILLKKRKLKINFDQGLIRSKKNQFEAFGRIEVENLNRNLTIQSKRINYNFENNLLFSNTKSIIFDKYKNRLSVNRLNYEVQKDILKVYELELEDRNNNLLKLSSAYINTKTNNLFGKDVFLELKNNKPNINNEPRLKGNSVRNDENFTDITKGVFTTCKRTETCPAWQLSAKKLQHDKKKRKINYNDAILKIYDVPVIYFPRFSHPDPTVDRQSGFLVPSVKNTFNQKNHLNLPYFLVISESRDATFSPRFYNDDQFLIQTEYRSVNYKSNLISDFSFKADGYSKLRSHIFYKYSKSFDLDNFIDSNYDLNIQKTSKDTYLKKNKINSNLVTDSNILENSLKFNFAGEDSRIKVETIAYENLNKNESDRYEYVLPKIDIKKDLDNKLPFNGNLTLNSSLINKNYDTNVVESINTNDLKFESLPTISKNGLYSNFDFLIKNTNSKAKNSNLFKNKDTSFMSGLVQINSSFPLLKDDKKYKKILNPKLAFKISPDHTKDIRHDDNKIDINNLYSFDRNIGKDYVEGGISLTYGSEYSIYNKQNSLDIINFKVANNLRLSENSDLPRNSQLDEQISSIFNEITFRPNSILKMNYSSSIKNNFDEINYENITAQININNLVTSFDYSNQNDLNDNSYLSNTTSFNLDDSSSLSFKTRRNKKINLTEYYTLAYQYKNDCLSASIQYNKEFYADRDIKPDEGIFLKFTIIPDEKKR